MMETYNKMIEEYLSKGGEVTQCPTNYPKIERGNKTSNTKDTRNTLGSYITTSSYEVLELDDDAPIKHSVRTKSISLWADAIDLREMINNRDKLPYLKKARWFKIELIKAKRDNKKQKRELRRLLAKQRNSLSKSGKVTQPSRQKRAVPIPPSKRV